MKYFSIVIMLFYLSQLQAQELKENDSGQYEYQEVIEVQGVSATDIFIKSKEWIALNYRSSNEVIQMADSSQKIIIGKGAFIITMFFKEGQIRHTFKIEAREGRFRATFNLFSYYSSGSGELPFEGKMAGKGKIIDKTEKNIKESLSSLKSSILKKKDDNW